MIKRRGVSEIKNFERLGTKLSARMKMAKGSSKRLSFLNKVIPSSPAVKKSGTILKTLGTTKKSVRTVHPHHIEKLKIRSDLILGLVIIDA
jgi:hypothetical protein